MLQNENEEKHKTATNKTNKYVYTYWMSIQLKFTNK